MLIKFFSSYRPVLPNFRSLFYSTELAEIVDGEGQICKPKRIKVILLDAFSKNPLSLVESPWRRERGGQSIEKRAKDGRWAFRKWICLFSPSFHFSFLSCLLLFTLLFPSVSRWKRWFTTDISFSLSLSFFYIRGVNTERPVHNLFSFNL